MMLSQALRLTCSSASHSDPIAYTLFSILLAAIQDGGGEAVDGGVKLRVTAGDLAMRVDVSSARVRSSLCLLQELGLLDYQEQRSHGVRLFEVVIIDSCAQERAKSGGSFGTKQRKQKETKEESFPRTSFIEERKEKKKERLGKKEREKDAQSVAIGKDPSKSPREGRLTGAVNAGRALAPSITGGMSEGQGGSLEERRKKFWAEVQAFASSYTAEELQSFYLHWARCDQTTGVMDFEADPKFELQFYLLTWHLNRPMFHRGSGGAGRGSRRGSVAAEVTAEQERQQKRIREQEASLKVVRERERLLSEMQVVPPVFCQLMKDEGKNLAEVTADEIFTLLSLRRDSRTLTPEQTQAFNDWENRRNRTAEALRRMESG